MVLGFGLPTNFEVPNVFVSLTIFLSETFGNVYGRTTRPIVDLGISVILVGFVIIVGFVVPACFVVLIGLFTGILILVRSFFTGM